MFDFAKVDRTGTASSNLITHPVIPCESRVRLRSNNDTGHTMNDSTYEYKLSSMAQPCSVWCCDPLSVTIFTFAKLFLA